MIEVDSRTTSSEYVKHFTMNSFRPFLLLICATAISALLGCSSPPNMQGILDKISHSPEAELPSFLYGYDQSSPGSQKVLLGMLKPLRAPSPEQHMSVVATQRSGRFTMVIVRIPWLSQSNSLLPIIIGDEAGKARVVGYVLPFDDIMTLFKGADRESIGELTAWWVEYSQEHR